MVFRRSMKVLPAVTRRTRDSIRVMVLFVALVTSVMTLWLSLAGLDLFAGNPLLDGEWMKPLVTHFHEGLGASALVIVAAVAAVVAVVALVALVRSSGHGAGTSGRHVLVADDQGYVLVENKGIESVACAAALRAPGVVEAEIEVLGESGSPIRLTAVVGVYPGAQIEDAGRAARKLVRRAVETLVGLEVSDVVVSVHVLDPEEFGRGLL